MLEFMRTTRGRVAVALVSSIAISVMWIMFGLSIAMLPGLILIQWIAVFTRPEPVSPNARLLTIVLVLGLAVLRWAPCRVLITHRRKVAHLSGC